MHMVVPEDWRSSLALLAFVFGWGPSDLMHLKLRDIAEWTGHAKRYLKAKGL